MRRIMFVLGLVAVVGCQALEAQRASRSPAQAAAERILRQNLLGGALPRIDKSVIAFHADRLDEPLDVSIAALLVGANRDWRGNENHLGTIESTAKLADINLKLALEMLAGSKVDATYAANVAKVGSFNQEVANEVATDQRNLRSQLELRWNQAFTEQDAKEATRFLPLLKSATDAPTFAKARQTVQQQLEKAPDLLKPFGSATPIASEVSKSRQRVLALFNTARRAASK